MRRCCVFFHAHPDDEALLTAGTMAGLAASGHRVVLVVATAGEHGLAAAEPDGPARTTALGAARMAELRASAEILGCARVVWLGYADSGLGGDPPGPPPVPADGPGGPEPFASVDPEPAAARLAEVLTEEGADLLTAYDPAGGYGHPDHIQVHRVGIRAAQLAGTPVVLEATVDRELLLRALRLVSLIHRLPPEFDRSSFRQAYSPRAEITHRVDVRRFVAAKRASIAAHASQASGGESERTLAALLRLPTPVFRRVMGTEWYVRRDLQRGAVLRHPLQAWPVAR